MSNNEEIDRTELDLQDNPEVISPPIVKSPLYACATAVTVIGFIPHADLELEVDGGVVATENGGNPAAADARVVINKQKHHRKE